jgi:MFS family permease
VLATAQAFVGAQLPMHFILGGLAGGYLSITSCFATLPVSMIIIGSTIAAPFLSMLMQKFGRRLGFIIGSLSGALGASISSFALYIGSFNLFLFGSLITGIYMSSYGFYRFAATDTAREKFRPKAISYVMAAGLVSAIVGPQLVKITAELSIIPFFGSYVTIIILNMFGPAIFIFLRIPLKPKITAPTNNFRSLGQILTTAPIRTAIICGMISYALMNLIMTSAPLAIVGCGFSQSNAADVVMTHVLAMSIPSFFTGHFILRFGVKPIIGVGLIFLCLAAMSGLSGTGLVNFFVTLILLGVGWNFSFIGATNLLANNHTLSERGKTQGINDMIVFGFVALASLSSGALLNCSGENIQQGWQLVNLGMFPLLIIATATLVVLKLAK